jgi:X-Pro dipeptidyl-peptidase (S15 family)
MGEAKQALQLLSRRAAWAVCHALLAVLAVLVAIPVLIYLPIRALRKRYLKSDAATEQSSDWWHEGEEKRTVFPLDMRHDVKLLQQYVVLRDGVRIAVDVWLPKAALAASGTLPCIFHQARYYRSTALRWPLNRLINGGKPINFINHMAFQSFLSKGMAIVSIDVRGTGASFGESVYESIDILCLRCTLLLLYAQCMARTIHFRQLSLCATCVLL